MTMEQLRTALHAQPFRLFVVHLADGRKISVPHPDFVALSHSGRTFIVYREDDTHNVIDLYLVTDLEVRANGLANGSKKRKKG